MNITMTSTLSGANSATQKTSAQETQRSSDIQKTPALSKNTATDKQDSSKISDQEIDEATAQVNSFISTVNNDIQFSIDKETGIRVVKVVDKTSNEIIRQFPGEEVLQIAKALDSLQGLLVKQQA